MSKANQYKELVANRTGLKPDEIICPLEKSYMTPCIARDGELAESGDGMCVGCVYSTEVLLKREMKKHASVR